MGRLQNARLSFQAKRDQPFRPSLDFYCRRGIPLPHHHGALGLHNHHPTQEVGGHSDGRSLIATEGGYYPALPSGR